MTSVLGVLRRQLVTGQKSCVMKEGRMKRIHPTCFSKTKMLPHAYMHMYHSESALTTVRGQGLAD